MEDLLRFCFPRSALRDHSANILIIAQDIKKGTETITFATTINLGSMLLIRWNHGAAIEQSVYAVGRQGGEGRGEGVVYFFPQAIIREKKNKPKSAGKWEA